MQHAILRAVLATMVYAVSLDLKVEDFRYVVRHPVAVGIGLLAQFVLLPLAAIYDYVAGGDDYAGCDGSNLIYFPIFNYLGGSVDTVYQMLTPPQALLAPGDAGAHVGTVCDASLPTTLLAHWTRDRVVKPAAGTPTLVRDLPAGGKHFVQKAQGYLATICSGQVVRANGSISAARPGRWARAG